MKHHNKKIADLLDALANPKLAEIDLSLNRITRLLAALGNPQDRLPPVIHVAGTNGKGSLLAYLTAIFKTAGYKVSRFTSPHLVSFNERILLSGREISDEYLLELLDKISAYCETNPVTFFEANAALAFLAFSEAQDDVVLLETGLGGRLDATNMIKSPALTAITPISIDHSEFLGNTLSAIAAEKAGILKSNVPCVVGKQPEEALEVIEQSANKISAPLYRFGKEWHIREEKYGFFYSSVERTINLTPCLTGKHQIANAAAAVACVDLLAGFNIANEDIRAGISHADWTARLQYITHGNFATMLPETHELWLDGGHNPGAGGILADWITLQEKPVHIICGMLENKDAREFIRPFSPLIKSFTAVPIEGDCKSYAPDKLADVAKELTIRSTTAEDIKTAIKLIIKEDKNCIILVCGSLYLAGNMLWQNMQHALK